MDAAERLVREAEGLSGKGVEKTRKRWGEIIYSGASKRTVDLRGHKREMIRGVDGEVALGCAVNNI